MIRTRLLITLGVVVALVGITLAAVALVWLGANAGSESLEGGVYKQFSAARLGATVGVVAALLGSGLTVWGLMSRRAFLPSEF